MLLAFLACTTASGPQPAVVATAPLKIDFGPLSSTNPTLDLRVVWSEGATPVLYLQRAMQLTPPVTYTCEPDLPKPCYQTLTSNCSVTMINGVENQIINGRLYQWMWYVDGNIGAESPCFFSQNSPNAIMFKLTEEGPK